VRPGTRMVAQFHVVGSLMRNVEIRMYKSFDLRKLLSWVFYFRLVAFFYCSFYHRFEFAQGGAIKSLMAPSGRRRPFTFVIIIMMQARGYMLHFLFASRAYPGHLNFFLYRNPPLIPTDGCAHHIGTNSRDVLFFSQ